MLGARSWQAEVVKRNGGLFGSISIVASSWNSMAATFHPMAVYFPTASSMMLLHLDVVSDAPSDRSQATKPGKTATLPTDARLYYRLAWLGGNSWEIWPRMLANFPSSIFVRSQRRLVMTAQTGSTTLLLSAEAVSDLSTVGDI